MFSKEGVIAVTLLDPVVSNDRLPGEVISTNLALKSSKMINVSHLGTAAISDSNSS
jgi:hypothetical protein